jgi:hypothetical protein
VLSEFEHCIRNTTLKALSQTPDGAPSKRTKLLTGIVYAERAASTYRSVCEASKRFTFLTRAVPVGKQRFQNLLDVIKLHLVHE